MAISIVREKDRSVPVGTRVRIRGRPVHERRYARKRLLIGLAIIAAVSATLWYDWYYGRLGLLAPQPVIEANPAGGRIIRVPPGGNIGAALEKANGGDVVELQAGAIYNGTVNLPNKPLTDFVTIRSSAAADLPAGKRVTPEQRSSMAMITAGLLSKPAILTAAGAHHYRFIGIEFGPTTRGMYNIIQIGSGSEKSVDELPHHIEFDRVYIHGDPVFGQRRGIAANGRYLSVTNSCITDIKQHGDESQAIAVWSADGPIEIVNNYLEAGGENILFGGAVTPLGVIPGNAVIRDNWLNKPVEWRDADPKWVVKNFLEVKSGRKIVIQNNLMTNNWEHAQEGNAVIFRTANDSGTDSFIEDIEFSGNIVRGSGSAVTIFGGEAKGGRRLMIRNNVFEDINSKKWGGRGYFLKPSTWDGVVIENNTVIHDGSITIAWADPIRGFVFRNNIVFQNAYGFFGDGTGPVARATIGRFFPGGTITNNVIVGGSSSDYGSSNFYPSDAGQIGFINPAGGDYRLRSDSRYRRAGIGADLDPTTVGGK